MSSEQDCCAIQGTAKSSAVASDFKVDQWK